MIFRWFLCYVISFLFDLWVVLMWCYIIFYLNFMWFLCDFISFVYDLYVVLMWFYIIFMRFVCGSYVIVYKCLCDFFVVISGRFARFFLLMTWLSSGAPVSMRSLFGLIFMWFYDIFIWFLRGSYVIL